MNNNKKENKMKTINYSIVCEPCLEESDEGYIELNHNNSDLEMIAKAAAKEIHTKPSKKWPEVGYSDGHYLMVMDKSFRQQILDWHIKYPGGRILNEGN